MRAHWSETGKPLTKAEQKKLDQLMNRNRDIVLYGEGAVKREAAKRKRQMQLQEFVAHHGISCFKCGATLTDWAKTGIAKRRGAWAICTRCVRVPKGAA